MEDTIEFSHSADIVFSALPDAISRLKNMKIARSDSKSRRAEINVSMNLTTWGETVVVTVSDKDDSHSLVRIHSFQRLFSMTGRRQQITHISEIFEALGSVLP